MDTQWKTAPVNAYIQVIAGTIGCEGGLEEHRGGQRGGSTPAGIWFQGEPYTYTHIHMLTYTHTVYGPCTKSRLHSRTHKGLSGSTWV